MEKCIYCNKEISVYGKNHQLFCKQNPNRKDKSGSNNPMYGKKGSNQYKKGYVMSDETKIKISNIAKKQIHTIERKNKTSKSMKKAHAEKRAWNIGKNKWVNKPSNPEMIFMDIIKNNFNDKNYQYEFQIGIYSADFCWEHIKKIIEIDGEQHKRFQSYIERDIRKDKYLISLGYQVLRVPSKDIFDNDKWIKTVYDFIHINNNIISL